MGGLDPAALEEQRRILEQIEAQKNQNNCQFCNREIGPQDEVVLLQSTDCFHSVHQHCFKQAAKEALMKNHVLACPQCGAQISVAEQKNYLSAQELEEIEKGQMDLFMSQANNIVKCPGCGNMMEAA